MAALPLDAWSCRLVVIGGDADDVRAAQAQVARLGVADRVRLTGPAPLAHLPWLLRQADVLCSPRRHGVNTPMKIYSYMAAGRPILATRIVSHTQVLDDASALLVDATAVALAHGLATLAADPARRKALGETAAQIAQDLYGPASFEARVRRAYATLAARPIRSNRTGAKEITQAVSGARDRPVAQSGRAEGTGKHDGGARSEGDERPVRYGDTPAD
jgi:glycosyltransferase involved in cell wall biosynthesis